MSQGKPDQGEPDQGEPDQGAEADQDQGEPDQGEPDQGAEADQHVWPDQGEPDQGEPDEGIPSWRRLFLSILDQKRETEEKLDNERRRTAALAKLFLDFNERFRDVLTTEEFPEPEPKRQRQDTKGPCERL